MTNEEVWCVVGTRPEIIKMAPVVLELKKRGIPNKLVTTGQHNSLFKDAISAFGLKPDIDLKLMRKNQVPEGFLGKAIFALGRELFDKKHVGAILAQGDTATVLAAAIVAFHRGIPFGHVEAGLRTHDLSAPFPEEYNRRVASIGAKWHFAPTLVAASNILREQRQPFDVTDDVYVTGNTVVDALNYVLEMYPRRSEPVYDYVFITCHRRENFGEPMERVFTAIKKLAKANPAVKFVYPMHPNPNVAVPAERALRDAENVILCNAMEYVECVHMIAGAKLIITDSGGIQEEAVSLGIPTLVTRETTERMEGVTSGACMLVGTDPGKIINSAIDILYSLKSVDRNMPNPYGDGRAAERIVDIVEKYIKGYSKET